MSQWVVAPVLLPLAVAALQLAQRGPRALARQRALGLAGTTALLALAALLLGLAATDRHLVHALGDWPPPFGIVLVLDRLAAMMVALTAVLALPCLLYAMSAGTAGTTATTGATAAAATTPARDPGDAIDRRGSHFHPLFQVELAGLNGAFLAGDLFNLFVCFEVLLIASYVLLLHGGGAARARAGLVYVTLNLLGSLGFLVALGCLYAALGTLNLADVADRLGSVDPAQQTLARVGSALLLVVFALKAALLPLGFWLPAAYSAAVAPVAALFAIMTKLGVVSILRVSAIALGPAVATRDLVTGALPWLGLATVVVGTLGALASTRLGVTVAWLVAVSAGTLLAALGTGSADATAAGTYYLVQSTLVAAGFFLLADRIGAARGPDGDRLLAGAPMCSPLPAGVGFVLVAVAIVGLPPFSGFLGKLLLLDATRAAPHALAYWVVVLASSFFLLANLARSGSVLFWESRGEACTPPPALAPAGTAATWLLLAAGPALALFAQPVVDYARAAAVQLHAPGAYVNGVLGDAAARRAIRRDVLP